MKSNLVVSVITPAAKLRIYFTLARFFSHKHFLEQSLYSRAVGRFGNWAVNERIVNEVFAYKSYRIMSLDLSRSQQAILK